MRADRSGLTLLEVLVALVVLALGATAWIGFAAQAAYTQERVRVSATEVQRASLAMARLSLSSHERLTSIGGAGLFHGFHLRVVPLSETLFEVSLADSATGAILVRTALYFRVPASTSSP